MLKLHHSPMACSLASRLALIEAGLDHEVSLVRTWNGEQKTPAYLAVNPRGKVPALETSAGVLTESAAILPYIADLAPEKGLIPADAFGRARAQSWLSFMSGALHPALAQVMFAPPGEAGDAARAAGLERAADAFTELDAALEGRDFLLGDFSVCDLYLLVFSLWRAAPSLAGALPPLPNLDRLQQTLLARPHLAAVIGDEFRQRAQAH